MKRIVICSDGTWNSPESEHPTNVLRLSRGIAPVGADGVEQVVFYDWGVGTDRKQLTGGISGAGIDKNIMDGYRFIVHNYDRGDLLFFFGFSRGAYMVRSLAGFIRNCGVIRREHAGRIPQAYDLYRSRTRDSHPTEPRAVRFRADFAWDDITRIEYIGVWDTVGSLGVPKSLLWGLGSEEYEFHDTEPSSIINRARHAVAIDEQRRDFEGTLWDTKPAVDIRQVWFAGVHSDVGGGYAEPDLSYIALRWMLREASNRKGAGSRGTNLSFEPHLLDSLAPDPDRPDALAPMHDSFTGVFRVLGRRRRKITAGQSGGPPLIHRSVKERWDHLPPYRKSPPLVKLFDETGGEWRGVELVD